MTIKTTKVAGRRTLRYQSLDEVLAEARRLADGEVESLGNWSLGQILTHLAGGFDLATQPTDGRAPRPMRLGARLMKQRILHKAMAPGFKLPKRFRKRLLPQDDIATADGLTTLENSIAQFQTRESSCPHPFLGVMNEEEWQLLMLRHCELHLSFVLPIDAGHHQDD